MKKSNPEIGLSVKAGDIKTNYHDSGRGSPLMLLHGSGPGVTGWANWRLVMPALSQEHRVLVPDIVGFGYTERPGGITYSMDTWLRHASDFMDAVGVDSVDLIGNSFGGALALAFAIQNPKRVRRLALMGSVGVDFEITKALDIIWGYSPSVENMRTMMSYFAYDQGLVNDELALMRYEASIRPGVQEAYSAMFPAPRQKWIGALASDEHDIKQIAHETLIIHGREDQVIPLSNSYRLFDLIPNAQLHVFGNCGHWTQIEHSDRFVRLIIDFLSEVD